MRADQSVACAALTSGRVACWGKDTLGVLGISAREPTSVPYFIDGVTEATRAVPVGWGACALRTKGPVLCWGPGQAPRPLPGTEGARDLVDGPPGVCVVLASGKIECFGFSQAELKREAMPGVEGAVSLTEEMWGRTCAVLETGKVLCWGSLDEIGIGKADDTPKLYPGVDDAVAVMHHDQGTTCVVRRDGAVTCKTSATARPAQIPARATQLPADGPRGTRCHRLGGDVLCSNQWDQPPKKVTLPAKASDLGCSPTVCCATLEDGSVHCLGSNEVGLLGDGTPVETSTPRPVPGLPPVARLVAGHQHTLALTREGDLYAWGWDSGTPAKIWLPGRAVDIDGGEAAGVARLATGALLVVRTGERRAEAMPRVEGEVLDGSIDDAGTVCAAVKGRPMACRFRADEEDKYRSIQGTTGVVSLSATGTSTCGLFADGRVACMIDQRFDEDDDYATGPIRPVAEIVPGLTDAVWLATPYAIRKGGEVVRITRKEGAKVLSLVPQPRLQGATQLTDGGFGWSPGCILRQGALECWKGSGPIGRLPVDFAAETAVAGNSHACALGKDGSVHCWGLDSRGALGMGRTVHSNVPVRVVGLGP